MRSIFMDINEMVLHAQKQYKEKEPALARLRAAGIERTWEGYDFLCSKPTQWERGQPDSLDMLTDALSPGFEGVLYFHIPFCREICSFCNYTLVLQKTSSPVDQYLSALEKELALYADIAGTIQATDLYIGGGTPSVLSPERMRRLFGFIRKYAEVSPDAEITFEVSPFSLSEEGKEKVAMLRECGVTRLNMGVQSFHPKVLEYANRAKSEAESVHAAMEMIRAAGFQNINIDLMYGLPHQNLEIFAEDIAAVSALDPESITTYHLRISKDTGFSQRFKDPKQRIYFPAIYPTTMIMKIMAENALTIQGYNESPVGWFYKRKGLHRAQYKKWRYGESLWGFGVSAYSHFDSGLRFRNRGEKARSMAAIAEYIQRINTGELPIREMKQLSREEQMQSFVGRALKTGLERKVFYERFGKDVLEAFPVIEEVERIGTLRITPEEIQLTEVGKLLPEEVAMKISV